jgi:hypothetical protein
MLEDVGLIFYDFYLYRLVSLKWTRVTKYRDDTCGVQLSSSASKKRVSSVLNFKFGSLFN